MQKPEDARHRLVLRRLQLGLSQQEMYTRCEIPRTTYQEIEAGRRWLRPKLAVRIAHVLNMPVGDVCEAQIAYMLLLEEEKERAATAEAG